MDLRPYYTPLHNWRLLDGSYGAAFVAMTRMLDVNEDGHQDLVICGSVAPPQPSVSQPWRVALGDGHGNFEIAATTVFPWDKIFTLAPSDIVFADFNEDGVRDLFVTTVGYDAPPYPGEQNRLFLSGPGGTHQDATLTLPQLLDFTHGAAFGDIDEDGDLDVYVGNISGGSNRAPYFLINDGAGRFTMGQGLLPSGSGQLLDLSVMKATSSALADLNGDGYPELLLGNHGDPFSQELRSLVLWNQGGSFSAAHMTELPAWTRIAAVSTTLAIEAADLNGDGLKDIVQLGTHAYQGWELQLLINQGDGDFADESALRLQSTDRGNASPTQAVASGLEVVDFNGDGALDLIATDWGGAELDPTTPWVWLNDGSGHFSTITAADLSALVAGTAYAPIFGEYYWTRLVETDQGWSFIDVRNTPSNGDLNISVIVASVPLPATASQLAEGTAPLTRTGGAVAEELAGGGGADSMSGGGGNDSLHGGGGNDSIDGGEGLDTARYGGAHIAYSIESTSSGFQVSDGTAARDGIDALIGVERLIFSDGVVALDIDGHAGQAYRLYQAAFDRAPDVPGLGFQTRALDLGFALTEVAGNFIASPEFQQTYGALDDVGFLTQLYANVLNRAPDSDGLAYHLANLHAGVPRSYVLVGFSESPENRANVIGAIENGMFMTF